METTELSKIKSAVEKRLLNRLASPGRRYFGQFIDFIITWIIFLAVLSALNTLGSPRDQTDVISTVVALIYLFLSDALPRGQSLGKLVLVISVIDRRSGHYCTLWQSFIRNVLTPLIGIIDALFILSKSRQRLGDMAAHTIVVKV